ncbi:MAG: hypothetical protein RL333_499 [Pseudomonadota bacterium]|jgi:hypothetical protein
MDIYWIYDIPNWQLATGIISLYLFMSLAGLFLLRGWIYRTFDVSAETNEMTNGIFSGVGVLYGLLVGLVAVAGWENFNDVDDLVAKEAAAVGALYRDISALRQPAKARLQGQIRIYLDEVIHVAWPLHQKGVADTEGSRTLSRLHAEMTHYKPVVGADEDLFKEALTAFNRLSEARRMRLDEVGTGIPGTFWIVILAGAILNLPLLYLFHTNRLRTHVAATGAYALFMGSMLFLLVAVDNPLRGEVSIPPDSFQEVLDNLESLDPEYWGEKVPPR